MTIFQNIPCKRLTISFNPFTHLSLGAAVPDPESLHSSQDGNKALDRVAKDNRLVLRTLLLGITILVNYPIK